MDLPEIYHADAIAFDTETTGLNYPKDKAFGFSVSVDGWSGYFDIRQQPKAIDWMNDQLKRTKANIVCHNASFDYKMALVSDINIPLERLDDTAIRACLIDEHEKSYSLDNLGKRHLNEAKESEIYGKLAEIFGGRATRNVQMRNLHLADPNVVSPYAIKDTELTLKLWRWQQEEIKKQDLYKIIEFERSVMPHIIAAEVKGIKVDLDLAEQTIGKLTEVIDKYQSDLTKLVGTVNVNSPKDMRRVFNPRQVNGDWVADNGTVLVTTDSGNPSLDAEALRSMGNDPRAELILNIRSTIKTRDTFIKGHVIGHSFNGRVYPNINQTKGDDMSGTGTGRLSYTNPAMQQIPSRNKKVAAIVKPIFLPDDGHEWASFDMNSFEVRVFAHLINDPKINEAYAKNPLSDFHQMVANLTGMVRNATYSGQPNAKQLNLSLIFNSGNGAIAEKMNMPWEWAEFTDKAGRVVRYKKAGHEAQKVIDKYHNMLPGVKKLADKAKGIAEQYGYVQTAMGRKLRFPKKYKTYKASGLAIQATAADINKYMWRLIGESGLSLILNTHDSYEINKPIDAELKDIKNELESKLRQDLDWFRVPLILDINGHGANWWEAINN